MDFRKILVHLFDWQHSMQSCKHNDLIRNPPESRKVRTKEVQIIYIQVVSSELLNTAWKHVE